jgi:hypothetical protein
MIKEKIKNKKTPVPNPLKKSSCVGPVQGLTKGKIIFYRSNS